MPILALDAVARDLHSWRSREKRCRAEYRFEEVRRGRIRGPIRDGPTLVLSIVVAIVVDKDRDKDVRPVDDYGDDYGLRGEAE